MVTRSWKDLRTSTCEDTYNPVLMSRLHVMIVSSFLLCAKVIIHIYSSPTALRGATSTLTYLSEPHCVQTQTVFSKAGFFLFWSKLCCLYGRTDPRGGGRGVVLRYYDGLYRHVPLSRAGFQAVYSKIWYINQRV